MNKRLAHVIIAAVRIWCLATYPRQALSFRRKIGRWPDPAFPLLRNDKYAWRRIFDRNPLFTVVTGKQGRVSDTVSGASKLATIALKMCQGLRGIN